MGDRAATPCDRSLGCRATPSTYPAGYALLVDRGIGLARVHDSRAERFLPGPDGHVPFSFPRFATHRLARTTAVWHVCFAKRHLSIPDLLKRLALAVRCGALGTCSALLRSGSSIKSSSGTSACPAESLGSVPTRTHPLCVGLSKVPSGSWPCLVCSTPAVSTDLAIKESKGSKERVRPVHACGVDLRTCCLAERLGGFDGDGRRRQDFDVHCRDRSV